jgi:methyl-accepting chemotaxis protein
MKADRIKTDFLHNVTDQIASPMERIKKNADYLRENYRAMSKAEVEKIVNAIRDDSDIITTHLNRLLEVALRSEDPTAIIPNDLIETTA